MADRGTRQPRQRATDLVSSRRDDILAEATKLFRSKGFAEVTVDEIGAAVGVTGPAIYRYFASKNDILVSVLSMAGDRIAAEAKQHVAVAESPREALRGMIRSYLQAAVPNRRLIGIYLQGTAFPADSAAAATLRTRQDRYLRHVAGVLRKARPELSALQARTLVHATYGVLNSVAWSGLAVDKGATDLLESAAMATMFSSAPDTGTNRASVTRRTRMRATA